MSRPCRTGGCPVRVETAIYESTGNWGAFDAREREPFSHEAVGAYVLLNGRAWVPAVLVEHFHTARHMSEEAARELIADYPHRMPHSHNDDKQEEEDTDVRAQPARAGQQDRGRAGEGGGPMICRLLDRVAARFLSELVKVVARART